jgi:hypothetical protein
MGAQQPCSRCSPCPTLSLTISTCSSNSHSRYGLQYKRHGRERSMSLKRRYTAWTAVIVCSCVLQWNLIISSYEVPVQAGTMRYVPRHHVLHTSVQGTLGTSGWSRSLRIFTRVENKSVLEMASIVVEGLLSHRLFQGTVVSSVKCDGNTRHVFCVRNVYRTKERHARQPLLTDVRCRLRNIYTKPTTCRNY